MYDGGLKQVTPSSTHLGQPLRKMALGVTELPMEVIQDYFESLRPIYTLEVRFGRSQFEATTSPLGTVLSKADSLDRRMIFGNITVTTSQMILQPF